MEEEEILEAPAAVVLGTPGDVLAGSGSSGSVWDAVGGWWLRGGGRDEGNSLLVTVMRMLAASEVFRVTYRADAITHQVKLRSYLLVRPEGSRPNQRYFIVDLDNVEGPVTMWSCHSCLPASSILVSSVLSSLVLPYSPPAFVQNCCRRLSRACTCLTSTRRVVINSIYDGRSTSVHWRSSIQARDWSI